MPLLSINRLETHFIKVFMVLACYLLRSWDGHLSKPLEPSDLYNTVLQWLQLNNKNVGLKTINKNLKKKSTDKPSVEGDEIIFPDFKFINIKKALKRVAGNKKLLRQMLIDFMNQKVDIVEKIASALLDKDIEQAKKLVHNLKGESATIEASNLYQLTITLEQLLRNDPNNKDKIEQSLSNISNTLEHAKHEISLLQNMLPFNQEDNEVPMLGAEGLTKNKLTIQLKELQKSLKKHNLKAMEQAEEINNSIDKSIELKHWKLCYQSILALEFDIATEHLNKYLK